MKKKVDNDDQFSNIEKYIYDTNTNVDLVVGKIKREKSKEYRTRYKKKKEELLEKPSTVSKKIKSKNKEKSTINDNIKDQAKESINSNKVKKFK